MPDDARMVPLSNLEVLITLLTGDDAKNASIVGDMRFKYLSNMLGLSL